jgi:hypothetical protein
MVEKLENGIEREDVRDNGINLKKIIEIKSETLITLVSVFSTAAGLYASSIGHYHEDNLAKGAGAALIISGLVGIGKTLYDFNKWCSEGNYKK